MLTEQIIEKGILKIKANLQCLIKRNDLPALKETWIRNFSRWNESIFNQVLNHFIDNADENTRFPRPYELKRIYYLNIRDPEIQKQRYENEQKELKQIKPLPRKKIHEMIEGALKSKKDGKL